MNLLDSSDYRCEVCGSTANTQCDECAEYICFDCCDVYYGENNVEYEVCLECFEKLTDIREGINEE